MTRSSASHGRLRCCLAGGLGWLGWVFLTTGSLFADPPAVVPPPPQAVAAPPVLSLDAAIRWALENNPDLAIQRQRRGIAAAQVVIARTYPFNPVWEGKIRAASGPASAGITNRVSNEHKLLTEVEVRGQRRYREQAASAALSRTEWEIASQEMALAVAVVRAFNTVLYRQEKLRLVQETVRLNEETERRVRQLVQANRLGGAESILAVADVDDARAVLGPARTALTTARHELLRTLGLVDEAVQVEGTLEVLALPGDALLLTQAALQQRPDLRARQAATAEAEARLRLEVANRFGNPTIGPAYEYDPTRINLIGGQINLPLPVFNTHRGEILQRDAERVQAGLQLRQLEVLIRQDVDAAVHRLEQARAAERTYRTELLPNLRKNLADMQQLFDKGQADVLRIITVRSRLQHARDGYLDALFEVMQAQADLAAAVGDVAVAVGTALPPP